jgi:hypothetical protein
LRQGWSDIGRVVLAAVVIDAVWQVWMHRGIFVLAADRHAPRLAS